MTIEAVKSTIEADSKLITIDDARKAFRELEVCPEDQIDQTIRYYGEQYPEFAPNGIEAAAVAFDMLSSMNSDLRRRFKQRYGVFPTSIKVIKEKAFGGLNIDPKNANLPDLTNKE